MTEHDLLELIYEALMRDHGLAVKTTDPKALRQRLYPLMKREGVKLSLHPMEDELWLRRVA